MSESVRDIEITAGQAVMLADAEAALSAARERWLLVANVILAGHGIVGDAELVQLDTDSDPPVLSVRLP